MCKWQLPGETNMVPDRGRRVGPQRSMLSNVLTTHTGEAISTEGVSS